MKKFISILAALLCCTYSNAAAHAAETQPVQYLQYDENWGSNIYSSIGNSSQTIANSGCGPTSAAMVVDYYNEENTITPDMIAEYAIKNGYRTAHQGTSWSLFSAIADEYNLEFMQTDSADEAYQWMQTHDDALIICSMKPGLWTDGGHFITIWNIQEDEVFINDPASTQEERIHNSYSYLAKQCKQYFCFNQAKPIDILKKNFIFCYDPLYFVNIFKDSLQTDPQLSYHLN